MTRVGVPQQIPIVELDLHWQQRAACRTFHPDLFSDPRYARWGLQVCADCTVQQQCADLREGAEGIWGGKAHYPKKPRGLSKK